MDQHGRTARRWISRGFALLVLVLGSQEFVSQSFYRANPRWLEVFSVSLTGVAFWAIAALPVARLERRAPLTASVPTWSLAVHAIAALALSALEVVTCTLVFRWVWSTGGAPFPTPARLVELFTSDLPTNLIMYGLVLGLGRMFELRRVAEERELRAARLETELARARLDALEAQLQPHFLFNTLSTIAILMRHDVDAAETTLVALSELLRSALHHEGRHEVSLREELELTRCYLSIEQTRYQDRLAVEVEVDDDTLDARVPTLLLQPLVENAIRHGIGARAGAGRIGVHARRRGDRLALEVSDDGPGLAGDREDPGRRPVGLVNTRARLTALYGRDHVLELDIAPGRGCVVHVELPFRTGAAR